ncbi:MAG: inositol monophosphatase [Deltaproteobacteria bacterium]|nr:MAG: inositol monophosphatase [Deltaproteobacteria bacterium]
MTRKRDKKKLARSRRASAAGRALRARLTRKEREEILAFTRGLARASGALALSYYGRANPTLRFDSVLITEADLVVQQYIRREVAQAYPDHTFLGEEGDREEEVQRDRQRPLWLVDPVDGSASFCAGMPIWAVSISLFDGGRPVVGVIYLPVTGELYAAMAGGPAMLNDRVIAVREQSVDDESLLLTYSRFHSDFRASFPGKVRSLGSSAAHMAYVARGAATAALLGNVHVWDIAAGQVILESAGGALLDVGGSRVELDEYLGGEKIDRFLVAAPRGLHRELSDTLQLL